uniref:C-type lectin domain-containing protein n=1 Tax=Latimeria chalumnae TaxID=7897 RepID=H2ZY35_LATCH
KSCSCFLGSRTSADLKYHFINEKKTWFEARDTCRENYTDLVSITSQQELWNITNITEGKKVWIGLFQNPWQWSNGDESSFQYWDTNEPNNNADDVCVGIEVGKWSDFGYNNQQYFLCYKEHAACSSVTTNATLVCSPLQSIHRLHKITCLVCEVANPHPHHPKELWNITNITGGADVWIGLYQNPWQWSNWDESSFQYWDTNQPSNKGGDEDCVGLEPYTSPMWSWKLVYINFTENFILIKENKTWTDALLYCRRKYRDLVSVTDCDVQKEVAEITKESDGDRVWIGLRKDILFGFWFWMDGNESDYEYWGNGVQTEHQTEHCGSIDKGKNSTWGFQCCLTELNFICSN